MVDVRTEIVIDRPRADASEYVANPDNAPKWYVNIKSVEWKTPRPLTIGSQLTFEAEFLGRHLVYTYEVVEFVPGQKFVMKTSEGPFPMETTHAWESMGSETTRMTLRNRGLPSGFSKLFAPFMAISMKRANKKDLERIKAILEQ